MRRKRERGGFYGEYLNMQLHVREKKEKRKKTLTTRIGDP